MGYRKRAEHSPSKRVACTALCAMLVVSTSMVSTGCKYTDVMTQHVQDQDNGTTDENQSPIYREKKNADPDSSRSSTVNTTSKRSDQQIKNKPVYSRTKRNTSLKATKPVYKASSNKKLVAAKGTKASNAKGTNTETAKEGKTKAKTTSGSKSTKKKSSSGSKTTKEKAGTGSTGSIANKGNGGTGKTYDTTGTNAEIPDARKIAAAGQYATIVQMLSGSEGKTALVGTDASWKSTVSKAGLFPNEGTSKIATVWTKSDGKLKINLKALKNADPDALLVDGSEVSLTKKQQKTIRGYGINVVTVPTLSAVDTPDKNITTAVDTVAEMMKKVDGVSTMGANYDSFRSQVLKNVRETNGGYSVKYENGSYWDVIYQGTSSGKETNNLSSNSTTVAFVDSWTTDVKSSPTAERSYGSATLSYLNGEKLDASSGVGLSISTTSNNFALMDYYFQMGGVVNNSYDAAKPGSSSDSALGKSYLIIAGGSTNLVTTTLAESVSERKVPSALWYSPTGASVVSSWLTVGDDAFPGVLTRSETYANTIVTSSKNSRGIYNVGQKYNVSVIPQGLTGSWADGTIESFLLSSWVQDKYYGTSNCASYVLQFYQTFYRYSGTSRNLTRKVIKDYSYSKTAGN